MNLGTSILTYIQHTIHTVYIKYIPILDVVQVLLGHGQMSLILLNTKSVHMCSRRVVYRNIKSGLTASLTSWSRAQIPTFPAP
jgi:hypothetical protein